ncbi:MAG: SGNH/GDSL hydrolase family protein [Leadbetterella sp.]
MKNLLFSILLLGIIQTSFAQNVWSFNDGDRVCFVGNSITHAGHFHHSVFNYYVTRYPKSNIRFFNCGISGDVTSGILKRMNSDILIHNPTYAVIMIGMNDVKRDLYTETSNKDVDTLKLRNEALVTYKKNLDSIVRVFLSKNIKVILQKPSIYDQTATFSTKNNWGVNDALKECADFIEGLSIKYSLATVDYWTIMTDLNKKLQEKDLTATIVSKDRVHPGAEGHLLMTYQFLRSLKHESSIQKITLNGSTLKEAENTVVKKIKFSDSGYTFNYKSKSLPMSFTTEQKKLFTWIDFQKELNNSELKIQNLKEGKYTILLDDIILDTLIASDLQKGINLAEYSNNPELAQSKLVLEKLTQYWDLETKLRDIIWVEIGHLKDFSDPSNFNEAKKFLEKRYETNYASKSYGPYFKSQFDKYFKLKPDQTKFGLDKEALEKEIRKLAQPKKHTVKILHIQ